MRRKIISIATCCVLAAVLAVGCGKAGAANETNASEESSVSTELTESETENNDQTDSSASGENTDNNGLDDLESVGDIDVDKGIFDVKLTIPKDFVGDKTQEELSKAAEEKGYQSVTLNEDGSATYVMTKKQHKEMMKETRKNIDESLAEMIGSEDYPNITDIKANEDYTVFTVTTKSKDLDLSESFSVMAFYMYGGMYGIFSGDKPENVHVDFVNADSGEIIKSADSKNMGDDGTEE